MTANAFSQPPSSSLHAAGGSGSSIEHARLAVARLSRLMVACGEEEFGVKESAMKSLVVPKRMSGRLLPLRAPTAGGQQETEAMVARGTG